MSGPKLMHITNDPKVIERINNRLNTIGKQNYFSIQIQSINTDIQNEISWVKNYVTETINKTVIQQDKTEYLHNSLLNIKNNYLAKLNSLLLSKAIIVDILVARTKGFLTGFNIGEVHVSITSIILGLVSFWVAMLLVKMLKSSLQDGSLSRLDFDEGMKSSIISGIGFFGFILSVILGIAVAGGSFKSLALMAGALSFGAGLGLQNVVSNLVAGITILFERPIKLGDLVVINGYEGVVKQISMRSTTLETGNKSNVIIPNSAIIAGSVVNKTYDNRMARVDINVGVDYDSDIDKVKKILLRIAGEDEEVLSNPAPALSFLDFGDSSLNFQLNCYTANIANSSGISFRIREKIINEFRKEGINIPFPQRVVRSLEESAAD